jgi:hypothetical protein
MLSILIKFAAVSYLVLLFADTYTIDGKLEVVEVDNRKAMIEVPGVFYGKTI